MTAILSLTSRGLRNSCTARLRTRTIGPTTQIRRYTTGKPPPANSSANLLSGAIAWLSAWWDGDRPQTQVQVLTAPPPVVVKKEDKWDCETNWVATPLHRQNPSLNVPTTWEYLFREAEDVTTFFTGGMPPPGDDFDLHAHVHRNFGARGRDAYYGTAESTSWKGEGPNEWNGPLHNGGDYLLVLLRAKGVSVALLMGDQYNEREIAVHAVRPERCVAWLNKKTGQIQVNPSLEQTSPEKAVKLRELLRENFDRLLYREGRSRTPTE